MPPILRPELPDVVQRQGLLDVVEGAEELVQRGFCWIVPRIEPGLRQPPVDTPRAIELWRGAGVRRIANRKPDR